MSIEEAFRNSFVDPRPFANPAEALRQFDEWLLATKAAAWDEGFDAGERDVLDHETFNEPCIKNPYRKDDA